MENVGLMVALAGAMTKAPSSEQVASAVDAWLEDHPEATTTVQDGAITNAKLASSFVTPGTAAAYSSSATYAVGDYVFYGGTLYRCTTAITTAEAWTAAHWTAAVLGDDVSNLKSAIQEKADSVYIPMITQSDKNILDVFGLLEKRPQVKITSDGTLVGIGAAWNYIDIPIQDINDTTSIIYTLSFEAKVEGPTTSGYGVFFRFNASVGNFNQIGIPNNTTDWTSFSLTSNTYAVISGITTLLSSGTDNTYYIRNLQLEVGTTATTYEAPLTAFDKKATARIDKLESYGIDIFPEIKPMAYKAYVHFATIPFTVGKRLKTNGVIENNTSYAMSDYILVLAGESVDYNLYSENTGISNVGKFDLTKTTFTNIASYVSGESNTIQGTYTPDEDCYIVFCGDKDYPYFANYSGVKETVTSRLDAIQNVLPTYWKTYLDGKKADINSFISAVGRNGTYFALFTDYHQTQNTGWTPRIVKNLIAEYPIDSVFNLGDDYGSEATTELAIERLNTVAERFKPVILYNCAGNHDSNPYGAELTEAQWYNPMFRETETKPHVVTTGHGYYYIDNPVQKVRYIVLNTRKNGFTTTDNDDTVQIPWFINVLNSVEDGWHVCVMMHMAFEWYKNASDEWYMTLFAAGNLVKAICDGYQNRATGTTPTAIQVPYDFTNAHGKMACVLSGHTHAETSVISDAGYSIIAFDRDAMYYPPEGAGSSRTEGTVTEQALYLVSINTSTKKVNVLGLGAGTDREFSFT